jgi:hypothetical protein
MSKANTRNEHFIQAAPRRAGKEMRRTVAVRRRHQVGWGKLRPPGGSRRCNFLNPLETRGFVGRVRMQGSIMPGRFTGRWLRHSMP